MFPTRPSFLVCAAARLGAAALLVSLPVVRASAAPASAASSVASGAAYAWGFGGGGQLGDNSTDNSPAPVAVDQLSGGVTSVAAGGQHTLAVQSGAAYAWGEDYSGELGYNATGDVSTVPVAVPGLGSGVTAVAAGYTHSLAIQNGAAYAWGNNLTGELGYNEIGNSTVPVAVIGLGSGVTALAGGYAHSLGIQNGAAFAWGDGGYGQLGNGATGAGSYVPVAVVGLGSGVTAIAAGQNHSLAVQNGAAYAWGNNANGELGNNSTANSDLPVAVPGLDSGVTAVAGGYSHSLAVQNGHVFAWGGNEYGQLGNGATTDSSVPIQVDPADLTNIIAVTAGGESSYALAADGSLWVWGTNLSGQLGLGDLQTYLTPQHLLPPSGYYYSAVSASASGDQVIAILTPGTAPFAPAFFDGQVALSEGVYYLAFPNGNIFGYYEFLSNQNYIYHFDLGFEYVIDANDGQSGVYFYDFTSSTFFYTSPTFPFPYLYDFSLNTFLYYYPDSTNPGHYTSNPRYFYDFATQQIIVK